MKCASILSRVAVTILSSVAANNNVNTISGPKQSVKITDHFMCTSANLMNSTTCTLCRKIYIGKRECRLGDLFHERLRDIKTNDKDASKWFSCATLHSHS